jgi:hypothetical protein
LATSTGAIKVNHADHLLFDRNSFTISLWIKLTNGSSNYNSASPAKDCYLIQKGQFADPGGKWYGIQLKDSALTPKLTLHKVSKRVHHLIFSTTTGQTSLL